MKPPRVVLIVVFLIAGAVSTLAQSADRAFDELHRTLSRAAAHELQQVESQNPTPNGGLPFAHYPANGETVPQETTSPELPNSTPAFARLYTLLPVMRSIFREEGVPQEFMLVGLVESGYQADAVSPGQAVGMWQFVPETAQRFGLINEQGDFRTDALRSTRAAARYLKVLLDQFQDWRLALAAYNAGEDRVEEAIRKAQSRDFSKLSSLRLLPDETRRYVPAVLGAIAEARNKGLLNRENFRSGGFYE